MKSRADGLRHHCGDAIGTWRTGNLARVKWLARLFAIVSLGSLVAIAAPQSGEPTDGSSASADRTPAVRSVVFPGKAWELKRPESIGLDEERLEALAKALGGRGCVVKNGYVVKAWGSQSTRRDWFSSAKPVLSTLLLFAIQEGKIKSVDQPILDGSSSRKIRTSRFGSLRI
jgi:hypothetical protein